MIFSKKILFLSELNIFTLLISLFAFFFNFKICYLRVSNLLKKKYLYKLLKKINIIYFSYENFSVKQHHISQIKLETKSHFISRSLCKYTFNKKTKHFFKKNEIKELFVNSTIKKTCEDFINIEIFISKFKNYKVFFITGDFYSLWIRNYFNKINSIYAPPFFLYFSIFTRKLFKIILFKIENFFNFKKITKTKHHDKNFKIIYFPHKGLIHGHGIYKSHFYNSSINPLKKKNILHVEWDKIGPVKYDLDFYKKNKIPYIFLSNEKKMINIIKFINDNFINFLHSNKKFNYILLNFIFCLLFEIKKNNLSKFKNSKLVIFGYDFLVPLSVLAIFKYFNIKTLSYQTRSSTVFLKKKIVFDYYYCLSNFFKTELKKNNLSKGNFISIGNILLHHNLSRKKKNVNFILNKNKFKLKCLVFNYNPDLDYFDDKRSIINNSENLLKFYNDLLILVNKFKNVLFILKSKNINSLNNDYLSDIIGKLSKKNNFIILDLKKYDLPNLYKNCDMSYGLFTSGHEDFLYLNKPAIIYDLKSHPSIFYHKYFFSLIATNLKETEKMFNKILIKDRSYFNKLNLIRKIFYKNYSSSESNKVLKLILKKNKLI